MREAIKELLYVLMRDELVPGAVERIVREVETTKDKETIYSNKHLERYAEELVERLGA